MNAPYHVAPPYRSILLVGILATAPAIAQVEWREFPLLRNESSRRSAMAFDSGRSRILLVGNSTTSGLAETWEWDGLAWAMRSPAVSPPAISNNSIAYDSSRGRVVLFGGSSPAAALGDTWEWDGINWTQAMPPTSPAPRGLHALAFDSWRNRIVLFGGLVNNVFQSDTWEWDGANWAQRSPAQSPPARGHHSLAFDSLRGRTVLFGGYDFGSVWYGDTWEWDGSNWMQQSPAVSPGSRTESALAFDSNRGVTVLVGGVGPGVITVQFLSDHWEWDGNTWTQRGNIPPLPRHSHTMAYDAVRQRIVVFGGDTRQSPYDPQRWPSDTLEYDGTSWIQHPPTNPDGEITDLVFDHAQQKVVGFSNAWQNASSWDGTTWVRTQPAPNIPTWFQSGAMASDPVRSRVVYFGGENVAQTVLYDLTWEWDGTGWTQRSPTNRPSPRRTRMAYHAASQRVVLFGGYDNGYLGDTWVWDGVNWTQQSPANAPAARHEHAMADDELRGVVVLHGGRVGSFDLQDTWEWNGANWSPRTGFGPQLLGPQLVYDRARERIVLTGHNSTSSAGETWEWDGTSWSLRLMSTPNGWRSMAYDPARRVTVLYDGRTWEYGPTHPASVTPFGTGCAGSAGIPSLSATLPWLGDTVTFEVTNLAASTTFVALVIGLSDQTWSGLPLPNSLNPLGMPGCIQHVSADAAVGIAAANGTAQLGWTIPNQPAFLGVTLFHQAAALEPGANAAGIVVSNATRSVLGGR